MKEYTYINKAYLGIKEGVVPPAPQYLWLNSKDDKLYKFGNNGWEVINNASYIVEEFTARDIITQANEYRQSLPISRALLDAMYKGVPIIAETFPGSSVMVPIDVDAIDDPSQRTSFQFRVKQNNIEYVVEGRNGEIISGNKALAVAITAHNSVDWNENEKSNTGYIANRTHHLGNRIVTAQVGNRISLAHMKGTHYFDDYKILYNGKFYDLPPMQQSSTVTIADYFKLIFVGYTEVGSTSIYIFVSEQISQSLPSPSFEIYRVHESDEHKILEEFYLPDGAKPWKFISATHSSRGFVFCDISTANIGDADNVIRNKTIYYASGDTIIINPPIDSTLEFKIIVNTPHNISISGKGIWENGTKPQVSSGDEVIYSFLILSGKVYASAKVYRTAR